MAGRIVRQGWLLVLVFLAAAAFAPDAIRAQDVIVFPPSPATTTAAATTPPPTLDLSSAVPPTPQTSVPTMLPLAEAAAQAAAVTTAKLDPKAQQCATDADCVLVTDGCGALDTVNQLYAANWKAAQPVVVGCQPVMDITRAQLAVQPVCRAKQCGQQAKANK